MLKKSLAFILFIFLAIVCKANRIDYLKTDSQVVTFLKSLNSRFTGKYVDSLKFKSSENIIDSQCDEELKSWGVKPWEKIDLNNDGRTDLLVNTFWYNRNYTFAVMDDGEGFFKLFSLDYGVMSNCEAVKSIQINGQNFVLVHTMKTNKDTTSKSILSYVSKVEIDTLSYRFGGFVELNRNPQIKKIRSVSFQTSLCYGTCPAFSVTILANGDANFSGLGYTKLTGNFKTRIPSKKTDKLFSLINYSNVKNLSDSYEVPWTDSSTATLIVSFDDGSTKKISDYGELGTFGLRAIYGAFFDLYENEKWQQVAKH